MELGFVVLIVTTLAESNMPRQTILLIAVLYLLAILERFLPKKGQLGWSKNMLFAVDKDT